MAQQGKIDDKYCEICNKVLESIPLIEEQLRKCKNCGLDVSDYEAQLKMQKDMASNIKAQFFPHRN